MTAAIRDNPARHRFEMALDGGIAYATYRRDGDVLTILHTEVPAAINGRGHGSALVAGVLEHRPRAGPQGRAGVPVREGVHRPPSRLCRSAQVTCAA